eukprot:507641-Rhodomonas_salina.1
MCACLSLPLVSVAVSVSVAVAVSAVPVAAGRCSGTMTSSRVSRTSFVLAAPTPRPKIHETLGILVESAGGQVEAADAMRLTLCVEEAEAIVEDHLKRNIKGQVPAQSTL